MPAPRGDKWETDIEAKIKVLEQLIRKPLSGSGASIPEPGVFQIDGNLWVTGDFTAEGKISNDALGSPVVPAVGHAQADGFTVPLAKAARATLTVPVPVGYTRAMVTAYAHASCFNPNAGVDYLYCVAWIENDTTTGWSMPVTVPPSESASTSQTATALLTGLAGLAGSFTVKAAVSSLNAAFTTSLVGNVCNIDATVLFLR